MEEISDRRTSDRSLIILLIIICCHLLANFISGAVFFLDDYSFLNQVTHSIIHVLFIIIIIKYIFFKEKYSEIIKRTLLISIVVFVILNLIPFDQGYEPHDNGFIPAWAYVPQTGYGWPFRYLRFFHTQQSLPYGKTSDFVLHFSQAILNIYVLSILMVVEIKTLQFFLLTKNQKKE